MTGITLPRRTVLLFSGWALLALPPLRGLMESSMVAHMLLQIPLLAALGIGGAALISDEIQRRLDAYNDHGLPFALLAVFVAVFWMLPRSLDGALNQGVMEFAKFTSVPLLLGVPLGLSWRRLPLIVRGFLWSKLLSMLIVLGWLYSVAPVRLCTNYLVDEQTLLGRSLLVLAGTVALLLTGRLFFAGRAPLSAVVLEQGPRREPA